MHAAPKSPIAKLVWKRYDTFFSLYESESKTPVMIYVIGESHHCYIGCVGCKGGTSGLSARYERQYVDRSIAIFGRDPKEAQVAFAGHIEHPVDPAPDFIELVEKAVQSAFIATHGQANATFTIKGQGRPLEIEHQGSVPAFLTKSQ